MNNKAVFITIVTFILISPYANSGISDPNLLLQIYLPRDITISGNVPTLGTVAILSGPDEMLETVENITMGSIAALGQKIAIDRSTILSRLASIGISSSQVKITGAEKISVSQQYQVVESDYLVKRAQEFLKENMPDPSICQWTPARLPKKMILPGSEDSITVAMSMMPTGARNQAKIHVSILSDDEIIESRDVAFTLKFDAYKLVAKTDLSYGDMITPQNVELQKIVSNYPDPADWARSLYAEISKENKGSASKGLIARREFAKGTIINSGMVGSPLPRVILEKNQNVLIKVEKFGLVVTTIGKALQDGKEGECIKIQNVDSQRIIMARVIEDGTVEPVL